MRIRIRDHEYYACCPELKPERINTTGYPSVAERDANFVCDVCAWQVIHEFGHRRPESKTDDCQYCTRLPWTIVRRDWETPDVMRRDPAYQKYVELSRASESASSGSA